MKDLLHQIADQKVDVYKENEKFSQLQYKYREANSKIIRDEMWIIAFRCACNILKKKIGKIADWEKISQLAIDMVVRLFERIDNRLKWPDGYTVLNLPTVMNGIFLTLYYSKKEIQTVSLEAWTERYLSEETKSTYNL